MTSTSGLGHDDDHAAVRPQPQHRRRGARTCRPRSTPRAGCCRRTCRTRRPTRRSTRPTAPILIYAVHSDAMPLYQLDTTPTPFWRSSSRGVRRRAGAHRRRAAVRRARAGQSRRRSPRTASASRMCATRWSTPRVDRPKGNLEGAHQQFTLDTNDQLFNADAVPQRHHRLPQRRAGAGQGCRATPSIPRVRTAHRRLVRRQAGRAAADPARSRAPTRIALVNQHQGDDAAAGGVDPARRCTST